MEKKECSYCKLVKPITEFYINKSSKDGYRHNCKDCGRKSVLKSYHKNSEKHLEFRKNNQELIKDRKRRHYLNNKDKILKKNRAYNKTQKGKFNYYKTRARKKSLQWGFTFDEFVSDFWQKNCFYCGDKIETVGIDRLDSSKGYIKNNCKPCCKFCNTAKMETDFEDFIKSIKKIYEYLNLKNEIN